MPAFNLPGLSTGQDTNMVVKKLLELEAKPIRRWERENSYNKAQIKAWNELKILSGNLQAKAKSLTSFTAPFAIKKIISSEPGAVTGEASHNAKAGKHDFEVLDLAARHQISGNPVEPDRNIPAGKFSLASGEQKEELAFSGGTVKELVELIRKRAYRICTVSFLKVDDENSIIALNSLFYGVKGKLILGDPDGLLKKSGLVKDSKPTEEVKPSVIDLSKVIVKPINVEKYPESKKPEKQPDLKDGKILHKPMTSFSYTIASFKPEKKSILEIHLTGGKDSPKIKPSVGIQYDAGGELRELIEEVESNEGKIILNLKKSAGREVKEILLTNTGEAPLSIEKIQWLTPVVDEGAEPVKVLTEAKDAKIKIDGVELTREKNEEIKDILEGASITLNKKTEKPMTIHIEADPEKGLAMIKELVASYNELVKFSRDITAANRDASMSEAKATSGNPDIASSYWEQRGKSGALSGDNTVLRLLGGLKTIVSSSYPSTTEPAYKVLSDIGITTGEIGSNWKKIQEGFLQIDEVVLRKALSENPESVKELFVSDINSDNRMDEGVGVQMVELLKPYTQYTSGLITGKVKLSEELIAANNKKIANFENHLTGYEKKLKTKFLYMEQGVGKNKAVGNYLQNNLKANSGKE